MKARCFACGRFVSTRDLDVAEAIYWGADPECQLCGEARAERRAASLPAQDEDGAA